MKSKLPESYIRLKQYALVVEDICKDIDLHGFGFEPGVLFSSEMGHSLDLPEWFLKRLYNYVSAQQNMHPTPLGHSDSASSRVRKNKKTLPAISG